MDSNTTNATGFGNLMWGSTNEVPVVTVKDPAVPVEAQVAAPKAQPRPMNDDFAHMTDAMNGEAAVRVDTHVPAPKQLGGALPENLVEPTRLSPNAVSNPEMATALLQESAPAITAAPVAETIVAKAPVTQPIAAVSAPTALVEPPKRGVLSRMFGKATLDEKLYKAGTALEQANAEKIAAEAAFETQKREAQALAREIEEKREKIALAQQKIERVKVRGGNPEYLKAAQLESIEAQRELVASQKQLNGLAKQVAEKKQALNTYSKNAEKAEHAFKTATGQTNLPAVEEFGRETRDRLADKDKALDKRARDLKETESKLTKAEKKVAALETGPNSTLAKTAQELEAAKAAEQEAVQAIETLKVEKAAAAAKLNTGTTAERIAAAREVAQKESAIAEALTKQQVAQKQAIRSSTALEKAGKPLANATATHDIAHQAAANGKYTNTPTSENALIKKAARDAKAAAAETAAKIDKGMVAAHQGMTGGMFTHTSDQVAAAAARGLEARAAAAAANTVEHSGGLGKKIMGGIGGALGFGRKAVTEPLKAGYKYLARPTFDHAVKPLAVGAFENAGKVASHAHGMAGNILLAGVGGVALLGMAASLGAPAARSASRLGRLNDDLDNGLAFAGGGNTSVEVGGIAMPSMGQSQGQSSWASRMPAQGSAEEQMLMNSFTSPSR